MFKLTLKDEDIVMKITVTKISGTKDIVNNVVANLLTNAGGDIVQKVNLILTCDTLYLEYKGHTSIGYAEETRKIETIPLKHLKEFNVSSENDKDMIKIITDTAEFYFEKNDSKNNGLALSMSNLINELKSNLV